MDLSPWKEESPVYNTVTLLQPNTINQPVGYFQHEHPQAEPFDTFNVNSIFTSSQHPRRLAFPDVRLRRAAGGL